ncbi:hypothetical protein DID88_007211 [Monilinia fructigena]|uniref:BZIP domain-containing protein n=1 Tax=Monilinia fructigena TaxID=38457 RepID=A0A395JA16_9HELO|nr:hypothetical protein DID88_007211 [Monilinia fructigena]
MAISTPIWYSPPSPNSMTFDQDAPCDLNTDAFQSAFPYTTCMISQADTGEIIGSETNDMIDDVPNRSQRSQNRAARERKPKSQSSRTRETSHDSADSISEKTPAQKMRRLVQNRVSQRNFRKRQANERQRLEDQVKMPQCRVA